MAKNTKEDITALVGSEYLQQIVKAAVLEAQQERRRNITPCDEDELFREMHQKHHEFLELWMEREERKQELWRKFKLSFVGTVATSLVGFLIWLGTLALKAWKEL